MPLRDYQCDECGHVQEEFRSTFDSDTDSRCDRCGGHAHWKPSWSGGFKISFREGYDVCTGAYHSTQAGYEKYKEDHGMVTLEKR